MAEAREGHSEPRRTRLLPAPIRARSATRGHPLAERQTLHPYGGLSRTPACNSAATTSADARNDLTGDGSLDGTCAVPADRPLTASVLASSPRRRDCSGSPVARPPTSGLVATEATGSLIGRSGSRLAAQAEAGDIHEREIQRSGAAGRSRDPAAAADDLSRLTALECLTPDGPPAVMSLPDPPRLASLATIDSKRISVKTRIRVTDIPRHRQCSL